MSSAMSRGQRVRTRKTFYRRASVGLYCAAVFLLPIFFVPAVGFGLSAAKVLVLSILVLSSIATYFAARSGEKIYLPAGFFMILGLLCSGLILATIFSSSFHASFLGADFEVGTFYTLFLDSLFALSGALIVSSQTRFMAFFSALFGGAAILALIHLLRFVFGAEKLTFGIFPSVTATPVGSWSDLGVFMGVILLVSLFLVALGNLPKRLNQIFYTFLFIGLVFVFLVNLKVLTVLLALFASTIFVLAFRAGGSAKAMPALITSGFLILLLISGGAVSGLVERAALVDQSVSPNFRGTMAIIQENLSIKSVLVGTGPNTFTNLWQKERSADVLLSDAWSLDFASGVSNLTTFFITHGSIVVFGFLSLFGYLVFVFWRERGTSSPDSFSQLVVSVSTFAAVFVFVMSAAFSLGVVPILLGFMLSGVAVGAKMNIARGRSWVLDMRGETGVLVLGIVLVGCFVGVIHAGVVVASKGLYSSALSDISRLENTALINTEKIDSKLALAARLSSSDAVSRARTELALLEMQQLGVLSESDLTEAELERFRNAFERADASSEKAIRTNPRNYLNWIGRGFVLETVARFQLQDTYGAAAQSYVQAQKENPTNPEIPLIQARLSLAQGNAEDAEGFARAAIAMRPNHTSAYIFLANAALGNSEPTKAISIIEEALEVMPSDQNLRYQLGVLLYANEEFERAIQVFDQVVMVDVNHANARYLRALSAFYVGDKDAALVDLEYVLRTNQDNENLEQVIGNIREGRDALGGVEDPGAGLLEDSSSESLVTDDLVDDGVLGREGDGGVVE